MPLWWNGNGYVCEEHEVGFVGLVGFGVFGGGGLGEKCELSAGFCCLKRQVVFEGGYMLPLAGEKHVM